MEGRGCLGCALGRVEEKLAEAERERDDLRYKLDAFAALTYRKEAERRKAAESREKALAAENEALREALHDCTLFLESADWKLGITRSTTPWDDGLRAMVKKAADPDAGKDPA